MAATFQKKCGKRVLVADSHPMMRQSLVQLLHNQTNMKCCAEASTVAELYEALKKHQPDMVIMELRLKTGDGIELIKKVRTTNPKIPILVFSHYESLAYSERAVHAGATGYVLKDQPAKEVSEAIETVAKGGIYLSRGVAATMLHRFVGKPRRSGEKLPHLTDRELHILDLLGAGLSTREIALALKRSFKTIESHRENIKRKLGLSGAAALVRYAIEWSRKQAASNLEPRNAKPMVRVQRKRQ